MFDDVSSQGLPLEAAPPVGVGDPAPDVTVADATGAPVRLADLWRAGPLVLVFSRHLGWLFCHEHMAQLRQRYAEFQAAGAALVVIGMGTPAQTREFIAAQDLPYPVLSDPRRVSHRAYGVMRGTLRQLALSPRVWLHGVTATAAGHKQTAAIGDPTQLSGTFIIDRAGIIRFADRADLSSDYTAPDTLLAVLARLPGQPAPPDVSWAA